MKQRKNKTKYIVLIALIVAMGFFMFFIKNAIDNKSIKNLKFSSTSISSKVLSSVGNAISDNQSKGTDEVEYVINYSLDTAEGIAKRDVTIKGTLSDYESEYARFKTISKKNVTSTVTEDGKKINIVVKDAPLGSNEKLKVKLIINNAPNGFKVKPKFEISEKNGSYTELDSNLVEVKTNSIEGIVLDDNDSRVQNIELSLFKEDTEIKRTYSNSKGKYIFSDLEEDTEYRIKVEESEYEDKEVVFNTGDTNNLNIEIKKVKPFDIATNKYIDRVKLVINGEEKTYTYDKKEKVIEVVKNAKTISGEIEYSILIQNIGGKTGSVTRIEDRKGEGLSFDKKKNPGWEEIDGKLIYTLIEGTTLEKNEYRTAKLILDIDKTDKIKTYINNVLASGAVYNKVVYILDGKEYRTVELLDEDVLIEPIIESESFSGWYTDSNYTNKYNFKNKVTKNMILYGKTVSEIKRHTVTLNYLNPITGEIKNTEEIEVVEGEKITEPTKPEIDGYEFLYWAKTDAEPYDFDTEITEDISLTTKYKINEFLVEFYNWKNDDEYEKTKEVTVNYNEKLLDYPLEPVKAHYKFKHWSLVKNGESFDSNTSIKSSIKLYSVYELKTHIVTFTDINPENVLDKNVIENQTVVDGEKTTIPTNPYTHEGYTQNNCYMTEENEIWDFDTQITKSMTLSSCYVKNQYEVSFDTDGGTTIEPQNIYYKDKAVKPANPSKTGYTFKGWYTDNSYETEFDFNTEIKTNTTIYAKFSINYYTVIFESNGGTGVPSQIITYNHKVTEPSNPELTGYDFLYWSRDVGGEEYDFDSLVTENMTLYAVYKIHEYSVSYYNGNEWLYTFKYNYNTYIDLIEVPEIPEKTGYTALHWGLTDNSEAYDFSAVVSQDINLYANYKINEYSVTFYSNGGTEANPQTIKYNQKATKPANPEKTGYNFLYWSLTQDGEEFSFNTPITDNITLYAKYKIKEFNVKFYNNNELIKNVKKNYNETVSLSDVPDICDEEHVLIWKDDNENEYVFGTPVTDNINLYSVFIQRPIVTFNDEGRITIIKNVVPGGTVSSISFLGKEGYENPHWSLTTDGEAYDFDTELTNPITLYAVYELITYNIDYNCAGGTVTEPNPETYTVESPAIILNEPEKEGYTFTGWSGTGLTGDNNKNVVIPTRSTGDREYTAHYRINEYHVSFDTDGTDPIEAQNINYYNKVTRPSDPVKTGYKFRYWSKDGVNEYDFNDPVVEDFTLHAIFTINTYYVSFESNGGTEISTIPVQYNNLVARPSNPEKTGHTFINWYSDSELENVFDFSTHITENITLYAKYSINVYRVTFALDGGIGTDYVDVIYNQNATRPNDPIKTGHTFINWYSDSELENVFDFDTPITDNITVYAKYDLNLYRVTFNLDGGIGTEYIDVYYNQKATRPENPTKIGHGFGGWYTTSSLETLFDFDTTLITGDTDLYAKWTPNVYTVTFDDEARIETSEVTYNTKALEKQFKGKTGYNPVHWSLTPGGEAYDFDTLVTHDFTLYAVYEIINYSISYDYDDGDVEISNETSYNVESNNIQLHEPTKYGYDFVGWSGTGLTGNNNKNVVIESGSTGDREYTAHYELKTYRVTFMNNNSQFEYKDVSHGSKVEAPSNNPTKNNSVFICWTYNNECFDFENTSIINPITLYSKFETVTTPTITVNPETWVDDKVTVTIDSSHEEYTYKYRIDNGTYVDYTGPFEVDHNSRVYAYSINSSINSLEVYRDITNIDKIDPTINLLEEDTITPTSITVNLSGIDNESGLRNYKLYVDNVLVFTSVDYSSDLNEEKADTYTFTGLTEDTTYEIKLEFYDYVYNYSYETINVTTPEKHYVARITKINGTDLGEENYIRFETLREAIEYNSCLSNSCYIEMLDDVEESNTVLSGQNITIDLNGKTIEGVTSTTFTNNGLLYINDTSENVGMIVNNIGTAILNNNLVQIGVNESPAEVSKVSPEIYGYTIGIDNKSLLNFYDGKIVGNTLSIAGEVSDTPYLYNVSSTTDGDKSVSTLAILQEAEARIKSKYYLTAQGAINSSNIGTSDEIETTESLLKNVTNNGSYFFVYDEENDRLFNNNRFIPNTTASSYIKVDLTSAVTDKMLNLTATLNVSSSVSRYGYVYVTESTSLPNTSSTTNRIIYIYNSDSVKTKSARVLLDAGKEYYVHFIFNIQSQYKYKDELFTIDSMSLSDVDDIVDYFEYYNDGTYYFEKDSDGYYVNNNQGYKRDTYAHSYIKFDMTNEISDYSFYLKYIVQAANASGSYGKIAIFLNTSTSRPNIYQTAGRYVYTGIDNSGLTITIPKGNVYYLHFVYYNYQMSGSAEIAKVKFSKLDVNTTTNITYDKVVNAVNEEPDTIQILKDINLSNPLVIEETRNAILDLNGHTLTTSKSDYIIKNNGELTIIDSNYTDQVFSAQQQYQHELDLLNSYNAYMSSYTRIIDNGYAFDYDFIDDTIQEFTAPVTGYYKLEAWGAQGGTVSYSNLTFEGGVGAYSTGTIFLNQGDKLYIAVGEAGVSGPKGSSIVTPKSFNGGGGNTSSTYGVGGTGGGATSITTSENVISELESDTDSIVMIAAGGGGSGVENGAARYIVGGAGGGHIGNPSEYHGSGYYSVDGATQTTGYAFGQGQDGTSWIGAGGGGLYGGYGLYNTNYVGGSGGSSYIKSTLTDKEMYCYNCTEYNDIDSNTITYTTSNYSSNAERNTAKSGNGFARITIVDPDAQSAFQELASNENVSYVENPGEPVLNTNYTQTGAITSSTNSVIYNASDLTINQAIINLNKSGTNAGVRYSGILNDGELTLGDNAIINVNGSYDNGVYNRGNGELKNSTGRINVKASYSYGLYNLSNASTVGSINVNSTNYDNTCGIYNNPEHDVTYNNINITGTYYGGFCESGNNDVLIKDSIIDHTDNQSSSDYSIRFDADDSSAYGRYNSLTVDNSKIYGAIYFAYTSYGNKRTLNIKNKSLLSHSYGYYNRYNIYVDSGTPIINIDDSSLYVSPYSSFDSYSIKGKAELHINKSTISCDKYCITNEASGRTSTIKDSTITVRNTGSGYITDSLGALINTSGTINIIDSDIHNNTSRAVGIINSGTINLLGTSTISGNFATGIRNSGTLNIGSKDGTISTSEPTINATSYAVNNSGTFNFYDGKLIGATNGAMYGQVTNKEDNSEMNIKNVSSKDEITLKTLSDMITDEEYVCEIGSNKYVTLQEAVDSVSTSDETTITVIKDFKTINNLVIPSGKKIKINYNGHKVDIYSASFIDNEGTLTVYDDSGDVKDNTIFSNYYSVNSGTFNYENINNKYVQKSKLINNTGTFNYNSGTSTFGGSVGPYINNNGTIVINDGTIKNSGTTYYNNVPFITNNDSLTINGGSISYTTNNNSSASTRIIENNSDLTINGGTITKDARSSVIFNSLTGTVTINDGQMVQKGYTSQYNRIATINEDTSYSNCIGIRNLGTLTINKYKMSGSTDYAIFSEGPTTISNLTASNSSYGNKFIGLSSNTYNGVETIGDATLTNVTYTGSAGIQLYNKAKMTINSGTYTSTNTGGYDYASNLFYNNNNSELTLLGGTFNAGNKVVMLSNNSKLTIGENDSTVSTTVPTLSSSNYGVYKNGTTAQFNFYDGSITAVTPITGAINNMPEGYDINKETVDNKEKDTLTKLPVIRNVELDKDYFTIEDALLEVRENDTLRFLRDYNGKPTDETYTLDSTMKFILDLNNKIVNISGTGFIINDGELTIDDSSEDGNGVIKILSRGTIITNNNKLTLVKGTISSNITGNIPSEKLIINKGLFEINGGTINNYGSICDSALCSGETSAIYNDETGTVNFNEGFIKNNGAGQIIKNLGIFNMTGNGDRTLYLDSHYYSGWTTLENKDNYFLNNIGTLTIDGGNIITNRTYSNSYNETIYQGDFIKNTGEANISNIVIPMPNISSYNNDGIMNSGSGELNFTNVDFTQNYIESSNTSKITMTNCRSNPHFSDEIVMKDSSEGTLTSTTLSAKITLNSSSSLTVNSGTYSGYFTMNNNSILTIYDGTFTRGGTIITNNSASTSNLIGGTYTSSNGNAVVVGGTSTLVIGTKGDTVNNEINVSTTIPRIESTNSAALTAGTGTTLKIFDGLLIGTSKVISTINEVEDGYDLVEETVDGKIHQYLDKLPTATNLSTGDIYYDLNTAFTNAGVNNTIQLTRNVTLLNTYPTIEIDSSKKVTFDLNNFIINAGNPLFIENNGELTIVDDSNDKNGAISMGGGTAIKNNNKLYLNSGTVRSYTVYGNPSARLINNYGTLSVNGGTVNNYTDQCQNENCTQDSSAIYNNTGATTDVISGTIRTNGAGSGIYNAGTLSITGGSLINRIGANVGTYSSAHTNSSIVTNTGIATITGGTYELNYEEYETNHNRYIISNSGTATISNNTFDNRSDMVDKGSLTLSGITLGGYLETNNSNTDINSNSQISKITLYQGSNITITSSEVNYFKSYTSSSNGTITINSGTFTASNKLFEIDSSNYNGGLSIIINDGTFSSGGNLFDLKEKVNVTVNNGTFTSTGGSVFSLNNDHTGTININGGTFTSNSYYGIGNSGSGTINIGTKGGVPSTTNPSISGGTNGLYNSSNSARVNFYDGIITGPLNSSMIGVINEYEPGYKITSSNVDNQTSSYLQLIGEQDIKATVNNINFDSLQQAVNYAVYSEYPNIVLNNGIDLDSNIVKPSGININIYLNGNVINYNGYTIDSNITIMNGAPDLSGSISKILGSISNKDNKKNIIIFEMDDGSDLNSSETYILYKYEDSKTRTIKFDEIEIGNYNVGNSTSVITTINGKLYLNNLEFGSYKLTSSNNKELEFEIKENGVSNNIRVNNAITPGITKTAVATLILQINTGLTKSVPLSIFVLLVLIIIIIILFRLAIKGRERLLSKE